MKKERGEMVLKFFFTICAVTCFVYILPSETKAGYTQNIETSVDGPDKCTQWNGSGSQETAESLAKDRCYNKLSDKCTELCKGYLSNKVLETSAGIVCFRGSNGFNQWSADAACHADCHCN